MSADADKTTLQSETCFLILKYLESLESCSNEKQQLLGKVYSWDGSAKSATFVDLSNKFKSTPNDTLISLLSQVSTSQSLLLPPLSPRSEDEDARLVSLLKRLGQILYDSCNTRTELARSTHRLSHAQSQLATITESDTMMTSEALRWGGLHRDIARSTSYISELSHTIAQLDAEQCDIQLSLLKAGELLNNAVWGSVNSGHAYLQQRQFGKQRYGARGDLPIAYTSNKGPLSSRDLFTCRYNKLWCTAGHFYNPAYSAVIDKTGQYVISGADDYLIKIWHLETGILVRTLRGHQAYITVMCVSNDNALLASGCTGGFVRVWTLCDGKCVAVFKHTDTINWLQFDVLTGALISASDDGACTVRDLTSNLLLNEVGDIDEVSRKYPQLYTALLHAKATQPDSSGGLLSAQIFPWNASLDVESPRCDSLTLPHIKDGVAQEKLKILSMDISPVDSIVVTGCEDGIARVWRLNDLPSPSIDAHTRSTRHAKIVSDSEILDNIRHTLSDADYNKMQVVINYLLCRLEGHLNGVTDVKFSNCGDRIMTGSLNDGTVRVWCMNRDYMKIDQIVINTNADKSLLQRGNISRRYQPSKKTSESLIYNISWSCSDLYVLVLHSQPNDDSLTYAIQTCLKVCNSSNGHILHSFVISDQRAHVLVAHPIESSIVFTSGADGIMSIWDVENERILGRHSNTCPENVPGITAGAAVEIVDAVFSADGTRLAATDHLGRVVLLGRDHPKRYENVFSEQYYSTDYAEVVLDPNGWAYDAGTQLPVNESPIGPLCRMDGTPYENQPRYVTYPQAFSIATLAATHKEILGYKSSVGSLMNRSFVACKRNKLREPNESKWKLPTTTRGTSQIRTLSSLRPAREEVHYIDDPDNYSVFSDSDFDSDSQNRNRRTTRGRRLGGRARHSSRNGASQSQMSLREQRSARAAARASRSRQLVDDTDSGASSDDGYDEYSAESDDPEPATTRPKRHRIIVPDESTETETRAPRPPKRERVPKAATQPTIRTVPLGTPLDRDWLLSDTNNDTQYCPQVGDIVCYFPQGHIEHLNESPAAASPPWNSFPHKWPVVECRVTAVSYEFPSMAEHRYCHSVIARVSLQLEGVPLQWGLSSSGCIYSTFGPPRATRHSTDATALNFDVTLRSNHLPDFLVPRHIYQRAQWLSLTPGERFVTKFKEYDEFGNTYLKEYSGTIVGVSDSDPSVWAQSPWESVQVQWEDGEDEGARISAWDAIPEVDSSVELSIPSIGNVADYVATAIEALMEVPEFQPFCFPVDAEVFPDYYCFVPLPINLDLILRRLQNNFYRQVSALENDIQLIHRNCVLYNRDDAPINKECEHLVKMLMDVITSGGDLNPVQEYAAEHKLRRSSRHRREGEISEEEQVEPDSMVLRITRDKIGNNPLVSSSGEILSNGGDEKSGMKLKLRYKDGKVSQSMYSSQGDDEPKWESKRKRKPVTYYDEEFDNLYVKRPSRASTQSSQSQVHHEESISHVHETRASAAMRTRYSGRASEVVPLSRPDDTRSAAAMRTRSRQPHREEAREESVANDHLRSSGRVTRGTLLNNEMRNESGTMPRREAHLAQTANVSKRARRARSYVNEDSGSDSECHTTNKRSMRQSKKEYESDSDVDERTAFSKRHANRQRSGRNDRATRSSGRGSDSESASESNSDSENYHQPAGLRMSLRTRRS